MGLVRRDVRGVIRMVGGGKEWVAAGGAWRVELGSWRVEWGDRKATILSDVAAGERVCVIVSEGCKGLGVSSE